MTLNNIEETVNFIKVNSNNILSEEEMNNFTIDIIKDNLKNKMKVPIIKAHLALIQELQNILNYNFNFVFDKKFLKSFILDEEQYNIFSDIVNKNVFSLSTENSLYFLIKFNLRSFMYFLNTLNSGDGLKLISAQGKPWILLITDLQNEVNDILNSNSGSAI